MKRLESLMICNYGYLLKSIVQYSLFTSVNIYGGTTLLQVINKVPHSEFKF